MWFCWILVATCGEFFFLLTVTMKFLAFTWGMNEERPDSIIWPVLQALATFLGFYRSIALQCLHS